MEPSYSWQAHSVDFWSQAIYGDEQSLEKCLNLEAEQCFEMNMSHFWSQAIFGAEQFLKLSNQWSNGQFLELDQSLEMVDFCITAIEQLSKFWRRSYFWNF